LILQKKGFHCETFTKKKKIWKKAINLNYTARKDPSLNSLQFDIDLLSYCLSHFYWRIYPHKRQFLIFLNLMMCTYFTTEIINIETISLHKSFPGKFHFSNHPGNKRNYSRFFFFQKMTKYLEKWVCIEIKNATYSLFIAICFKSQTVVLLFRKVKSFLKWEKRWDNHQLYHSG